MKLRKLLIALLAAALLCTAVGAAGYSDLPDTHWANKQVAYLQGEIKGYPDATFRPNNTVTRAEFLTMFARVAYPEEYQAQDASARRTSCLRTSPVIVRSPCRGMRSRRCSAVFAAAGAA